MTRTTIHFEQIPVRAIKKLVEKQEAISRKASLPADNVTVETPANKTEPYSVRKTS